MANLTDDERTYVYHVNPPRARVSVGITLNLGNFQSFRIDTSYEDSQREDESLTDLFKRVRETADDEASKAKEDAEAKLGIKGK